MPRTVGGAPSVDLPQRITAVRASDGGEAQGKGDARPCHPMTIHSEESATPVPAAPEPGSRRDIIDGAKAMAPMMPGYLSFGVVLGAAISHGTNPWAGWFGADLIYGGSAQLTLLEMMHSGSGVLAAAGAALLINARLLVYSSSLIPLWGSARVIARLLAAAAVVDPTWIISTRRAQQGGTLAQQRAHYAGAATLLTAGWTGAVTAGLFLGSAQSVAGLLGIAVPLCLVVVIAPHTRLRGGLTAVAGAAIATLASSGWPAGSGLLMAMAVAGFCGAIATRRSS